MKQIAFFSLMLVFIACSSFNSSTGTSIKPSGKVVSKEFPTQQINALDLAVLLDVELIPSDKNRVIVETDDNVQQYVLVKENNGTLDIRFKSGVNFKGNVHGKVTIYSNSIEKIKNESIGNLTCKQPIKATKFELTNKSVGDVTLILDVEKLELTNQSVGDVIFKGTCASMEIDNSSVGDLKTTTLDCKNVKITNKSVGDTFLKATDSFVIENNSVGDMTISGGGKIDKLSNKGVGEFKKG